MAHPQENEPTESQDRPNNAFVAVLADQAAVHQVLDDLTQLGMDVSEVHVLHGKDGIAAFDYTGERHGGWAYIRRSIKNIGGADANILLAYEESLQHRKSLILVPRLDFDFDDLVDILRRHSARNISFFTPGSLETISSDATVTTTETVGGDSNQVNYRA